MRQLKAFVVRLRGLFRPEPLEAEFADELESHIALHTAAGVRAGLSPAEARRRALICLGGAEQARQLHRDRRTLPWLDNLLRDVRHALRGFRRSPVFTMTMIATLALGIGATTAVFSVVDRILFRSLPYAHSESLVSVGLVAPIIPQEFMLGGSYYDWRDNQTPFSALTSETGVYNCNLTEHNPSRLNCGRVEQNFLPTLGVTPMLGRNFLPEEDRPNGPRVALISYALWRGHYGADTGIVNKLIDIDDKQVRVIGVLPRDFEFPTLEATDVVEPEALDEAAQRKAMPGAVMYAFARLKPNVSIAQAENELQPVFNYSLSLAPPAFRKEVHLRVRSIRDRQMHDVRFVAWMLFAAALAVLLIASANVMSLLMARGATREQELATRYALGASRCRLARQMLTETLLLSLAGAAVGCVQAEILLRIFISIAPASIPFLDHAHLDVRIIVFTLLLSLLCGAVFSTLAVLHKPHATALKGRFATSGHHAFLRRSLVTGQIAITMVLLAGAALLLRSFRNLEEQNIGLNTRGVLAVHIPLPHYRYDTPQKRMEFFLRAEAALRRLPGVQSVGLSDSLPPGEVTREQIYNNIGVAGKRRSTNGTGGMVVWRWVTPQYFNTLDISVVRGQALTEDERTASERLIVLSTLLASRLFADQDPIGKQIQPVPEGPWCTVAAVVADAKNAGLTGEDKPEFYRLRRNLPEDWNTDSAIVLKTPLPPQGAALWVRSQIAQIDSTVPVEIETVAEDVNKLADQPRFETALLGFFASCGLLMAVVGLYGVISFIAAQRTREIGVRMALGASRTDILKLIMSEGTRLVVLGGAVGLAAALGLSRLIKNLLFHVGSYDPLSFLAVAVLLASVALAATLVPARAAMKTDPMQALRTE